MLLKRPSADSSYLDTLFTIDSAISGYIQRENRLLVECNAEKDVSEETEMLSNVFELKNEAQLFVLSLISKYEHQGESEKLFRTHGIKISGQSRKCATGITISLSRRENFSVEGSLAYREYLEYSSQIDKN